MPIDFEREKITATQFFSLPQEERLKIITRHLPLNVKIPFFLIGVFGILINCCISAFAGTIVYAHIAAHGYTDFTARFVSMALFLFSSQILNSLMNKSGRWIIHKLYKNL